MALVATRVAFVQGAFDGQWVKFQPLLIPGWLTSPWIGTETNIDKVQKLRFSQIMQ
jgi:hypothetical protein